MAYFAGLGNPVSSAGFDPPIHGYILGASGTLSYGKGIGTITHIGTGHWQVDILSAIPEHHMVIIVQPIAGSAIFTGINSIDTNSLEITAYDAAGAAADVNFFITCFAAVTP